MISFQQRFSEEADMFSYVNECSSFATSLALIIVNYASADDDNNMNKLLYILRLFIIEKFFNQRLKTGLRSLHEQRGNKDKIKHIESLLHFHVIMIS